SRTWKGSRVTTLFHHPGSIAPRANSSTSVAHGPERRKMRNKGGKPPERERPITWSNRLTVIGSKSQVQRFRRSNWDRVLSARYCDLIEISPKRFVCEFKTERLPLERLRSLSSRFERLTLFLDYESEKTRIKGLAKAYL